MVPTSTKSSEAAVKRDSRPHDTGNSPRATPVPRGSARERILAAAFAAFTGRGYAAASTLDIATRARVSKRELYAFFGSKQQMLTACIAERAQRMRLPADREPPRNAAELEAALREFGATLLEELSDPDVIAVLRLAVGEAERSPEIARALDRYGRRSCEAALRALLEAARAAGAPLAAEVEPLVGRFMAALLDDLPMSLALGLRARPAADEIARRAGTAARTVLGS